MVDRIKDRIVFMLHVLGGLRTKWLLSVWLVVGVYDLACSQFLPSNISERMPNVWQMIEMTTGWLSPLGWTVALLGILVVAGFEFLYRNRRMPPVQTPTQSARMPLIELCAEAQRLGLNLANTELLEFTKGLRQAGLDGDVKLSGRPMHSAGFETLTQGEPLHSIPHEHWKEFQINALSLLEGDTRNGQLATDNIHTRTYVMGANEPGGYADIQVDRGQALHWLRELVTTIVTKP